MVLLSRGKCISFASESTLTIIHVLILSNGRQSPKIFFVDSQDDSMSTPLPSGDLSSRCDAFVDEGLQHQQNGRLVEAESFYTKVLTLMPQHIEALHLLGLVHHQRGQFATAVELIAKAIALKSIPCPILLTNMGAALQQCKRWDEAEDAYRRAIQAKPSYLPAHENLCKLLPSRSKVLAAADAWKDYGNQLLDADRSNDAYIQYRLALEFKPDDSTLIHGLATTLASLGRLEESLTMYRAALVRDKQSPLCINNLGWILFQLGQLDQSISCFRQAIAIAPQFAEAHMCLSAALLRTGQLEEGWKEYEWRWKSSAKQFARVSRSQPEWQGEPLNGRTLLVECEQGLGDILQFVRYVELLLKRGERILFRCPKVLYPLLEHCSTLSSCLVRSEELLPPYDFFVPLLSLPRHFGTTVETIPQNVPYLHVPESRIKKWKEQLGEPKRFRIGIAWQGSTAYRDDSQRSFRLNKFGPLAYLPNVELVSLQKGEGTEQLDQISFPVRNFGNALDSSGPFLDTAAIMRNVDLVIAPNTSIAHLGGALHVPTWVILSRVATDWRWIENRDDTPWYPNMRLFRQGIQRDWDEVFNRVYGELAKIC
jgi:tetratricopeptide (TPR) repeat protein